MRKSMMLWAGAVLAVALPLSAPAIGLPGLPGGGGPSVGPGGAVVGYSSNTMPIATPSNVVRAASWTASTINSQITEVGKTLADIGQSNTAAMNELFKSQRSNEKAVNQAMGVSRSVSQAMRMYGPASRTEIGCGSVKTAGGAAYTVTRARIGAARYGATIANYSRSVSSKTDAYRLLGKALGAPGHTPGASSLFGAANGVATPSRCVAVKAPGAGGGSGGTGTTCQDASFAAMVVDPIPHPVLGATQAGTPAGRRYRMMRRLELSQLSLPKTVLAKIASWHQADAPAPSSIRKLWTLDHMPSPPPWNSKGEVSPDSLINAQVALRYENPVWMLSLNSKDNGYALMREIAMNQAIGLEISRRRMLLDEYIASLLASQNALSVREHLGSKLDSEYLSAQSNAPAQ